VAADHQVGAPGDDLRTHVTPRTSPFTALRSTLAARRGAREDRIRLEQELASYDTASARAELDAILGRYTDDETREVQEILSRQSSARLADAGR
jgi:hypothetical protein